MDLFCRWAQIAKHLPGRTDSEIKNYWNSYLKKKLLVGCNDQSLTDVSKSSYSTSLKHLDMHGHSSVEDDHIVNHHRTHFAKNSNGFIEWRAVELELCPYNSRISVNNLPVRLAQQTMSSGPEMSWTNCSDENFIKLIADAMPNCSVHHNENFVPDAGSSHHDHGMIRFSANDQNRYINVPCLTFDRPEVNSRSAVIKSAFNNMISPDLPRQERHLQ